MGYFPLLFDVDPPTDCISAEGESKCVDEELKKQIRKAFLSLGEPGLPDLPKGPVFNVKIAGEVCGVRSSGLWSLPSRDGKGLEQLSSKLCGSANSSSNWTLSQGCSEPDRPNNEGLSASSCFISLLQDSVNAVSHSHHICLLWEAQ